MNRREFLSLSTNAQKLYLESGLKPSEIKRLLAYVPRSPNSTACKTCEYYRPTVYHGRRYRKCLLIGLSHSAVTDINAGGTCESWNRLSKSNSEGSDE